MAQTLIWHPARANPLDYIGNPHLVDYRGHSVEITKTMGGSNFTVTIDGYPAITGGNIETCAYLNQRSVGVTK